MHNPVFSISRFGAFEYPVPKGGGTTQGQERLVSSYEFEFYTELQYRNQMLVRRKN